MKVSLISYQSQYMQMFRLISIDISRSLHHFLLYTNWTSLYV